jgi:hypothetical protein
MHSSLTTRTNVLLLGLYAAVIIACVIAAPSRQLVLLTPFAFGGFIAGALQAKAVSASPSVFRGAESWSAVRRALGGSLPGKFSLVFLWLNGAVILCLLILGKGRFALPTLLSAYASFGAARELATFRSVRMLNEQHHPSRENGA